MFSTFSSEIHLITNSLPFEIQTAFGAQEWSMIEAPKLEGGNLKRISKFQSNFVRRHS